MSQSVKQNKNCLLSSRSRSQRGLILSKYYSDYYIFWTADLLATRRGLMIGYHRPERLVKTKMNYCIQGQGHSEGSKCRCLSRWYFLNRQTFCSQTRIVMHHNERECHAKKKPFAIFKVKVTARARIIKIWQFLLYLLNCWSFSTKHGLMVHYHKPECLMKKLDCCVQGQGHGKISKCQLLFIQMLSSEMLNLILANLVR